jgi:hypothetical protein
MSRLGSLHQRAQKIGSARLARGSGAEQSCSELEPAREPRAYFLALGWVLTGEGAAAGALGAYARQ